MSDAVITATDGLYSLSLRGVAEPHPWGDYTSKDEAEHDRFGVGQLRLPYDLICEILSFAPVEASNMGAPSDHYAILKRITSVRLSCELERLWCFQLLGAIGDQEWHIIAMHFPKFLPWVEIHYPNETLKALEEPTNRCGVEGLQTAMRLQTELVIVGLHEVEPTTSLLNFIKQAVAYGDVALIDEIRRQVESIFESEGVYALVEHFIRDLVMEVGDKCLQGHHMLAILERVDFISDRVADDLLTEMLQYSHGQVTPEILDIKERLEPMFEYHRVLFYRYEPATEWVFDTCSQSDIIEDAVRGMVYSEDWPETIEQRAAPIAAVLSKKPEWFGKLHRKARKAGAEADLLQCLQHLGKKTLLTEKQQS